MKQYYTAVNLDKKELICPHALDCGSKLMDFSYATKSGHANYFIRAFTALMDGSWMGDRVFVVGDCYDVLDKNTPYYVPDGILKERKDIITTNSFQHFPWLDLYNAEEDGGFKELDFKKEDLEGLIIPRYICNKERNEYVDIQALPTIGLWTNEDGIEEEEIIFPLTLLLALGNGLGGGDYHGIDEKYVGSWAPTTRDIFLSNNIPEGYKQFPVSFFVR
jgi:hypothetical protein